MANPYPMQPMQPMQPMHGMQPQMGRPPVMRRGTSRAVPVVVSAGLAIGVFCGLLFGLGVPDETAEASASTTATETTSKPDNEVPEPFQPTQKKDVPGTTTPGTTTPPANGSAAKDGGSAAVATNTGSGNVEKGSAATVPAAPTKLIGKLTIVIKPEAVAKTAKIFVDGKQLDENTYEVDLIDKLDKTKNEARKNVKVVVKASGYREVEQKIDIVAAPNAENNNNYEVELIKRPTGGGGTTPPRPPPPGGKKCKKPPCGLIDI